MNNNGKKLLDKLSELDPELITNADKKPVKRSGMIIGFTSGMAAVAAATLIAVAANHVPERVPPIAATSEPVSSSSGMGTSDTNSSSAATSVQEPVSVSTESGDTVSAPVTTAPADPPQLDFSKYKDLPKISDADYGVRGSGGAGCAGATDWLYSWELEDASPWKGAELETMPVYMSSSTETPDLTKMYARVKEIAAALGISADELEFTDDYIDVTGTIERHRKIMEEAGASEEEIEEELNRIIRSSMSQVYVQAENDKVRISLNMNYSVQILFNEPVELPEGYNFSNNATADEKSAALGYLADKYKALTGYGAPLAVRSGGNYGSYIYETDGDLTREIVNYWINNTQFHIDEESGKLSVIWIYTDGALEKIADYPVLTAAQAEAILKSNKYDDDNRMPADAKILKTELFYSNPSGATAVMPYYKLYVETDQYPLNDYDVVCDVYTIAAVPEEFIDMETKDYGVRA